MRAAIYIRVSTEDQVDGTSLETQTKDCQAYAAKNGWAVVGVYADEGLSGRRDDRPALQRLLADAKARAFDLVLVWKLDRFGRETEAQLRYKRILAKTGVVIQSYTERGDFYSAAGHISFVFSAGMAEAYSLFLGERMTRALTENAEQGRHNGPVPIGYRRGPDGVLVATEDAPAVLSAFELYATRRYTYDTLADALAALGHTALDWQSSARKPFSRESVRFLLKNKTYLGLVQHKGIWHPGQHQPLISQERFAACQTIMEHRSSWRGVPIVHAPPRLLHGLTWCEDCRVDDDHANKMWLHYSGKTGQTGYYRCAASRDHTCTQGKASARRIEQTIVTYLEQLEATPSIAQRILDTAYRLAEQPLTAIEAPAPSPRTLDAKRQKLTDLWSRGLLPDAEYEQALIRLQHPPAPTSTPPAPAVRINEALLQTLTQDIPRMIRAATPEERRAIVQDVFNRVWIGEKQVKALTPTRDVYPLLASVVSLRAEVGAMGWLMGLRPVVTPMALIELPLRPLRLAA